MRDHLEPVSGPFFGVSLEYYMRLRQTLLAGLDATPLVSLVGLPSFAPEFALVISRETQRYYDERYRATYRVGKSNVWQAMRNPLTGQPEFLTCDAELPLALAQALAAVVGAALAQTRYAEAYIMLDGATYHFATRLHSGQTRSPDPASRLHELVDLFSRLIQQLTHPVADQGAWAELTAAAHTLQRKFEAA